MSNLRKVSKWFTKQTCVGLALLVLLSSCDDGEIWKVSSNELVSPAGQSSGEPFLTTSGEGVFMSWLEANGPSTFGRGI